MSKKVYIGDGVYASFDGWHVVLTTEDGLSASNTIFLEPAVIERLLEYWNELNAKLATERKDGES